MLQVFGQLFLPISIHIMSFHKGISSSKSNQRLAICLTDTPRPPQLSSSPRNRTEPFSRGTRVSQSLPPQSSLEGVTELVHSQSIRSNPAREAVSMAAAKVLESPCAENSVVVPCRATMSRITSRVCLSAWSFTVAPRAARYARRLSRVEQKVNWIRLELASNPIVGVSRSWRDLVLGSARCERMAAATCTRNSVLVPQMMSWDSASISSNCCKRSVTRLQEATVRVWPMM